MLEKAERIGKCLEKITLKDIMRKCRYSTHLDEIGQARMFLASALMRCIDLEDSQNKTAISLYIEEALDILERYDRDRKTGGV